MREGRVGRGWRRRRLGIESPSWEERGKEWKMQNDTRGVYSTRKLLIALAVR